MQGRAKARRQRAKAKAQDKMQKGQQTRRNVRRTSAKECLGQLIHDRQRKTKDDVRLPRTEDADGEQAKFGIGERWTTVDRPQMTDER